MTTYRTGNPIGSTDPRDLYDNAENLDTAVNDTNRDTWSDRLGRSRQTLKGMDSRFNSFIASSGYQFIGDYAAGIEITEYNQIVRDADGEFWRLSGQVELPYTTTGSGIPENDALIPVGDAALRQQLNDPLLGGSLVSLPQGGSVTDAISYATPQMFGALGNGIKDDTLALKSALNSGVKVVLIPAGEYRVTEQINIPVDVSVVGEGRNVTTITAGGNAVGTFPNNAVLYKGGESPSPMPNIAASVNKGESVIRFSSAHGLSTGDVFLIYNPTDGSFSNFRPDYRAGEYCTVSSIVSDIEVEIESGLYASYNPTGLQVYRCLSYCSGAIKGLTAIAPGPGANGIVRAIAVEYGHKIELEDLGARNSDNTSFSISKCYKVNGRSLDCHQWSQSPGFSTRYGMVIGNSQEMRVSGSFVGYRHGIALGGGNAFSVPNRAVNVHDFFAKNSSGSIAAADWHGNVEHCTYENGEVHGGGFNISGNNNRISNIKAFGEAMMLILGREMTGCNHIVENIECYTNRNDTLRGIIDIGGNTEPLSANTRYGGQLIFRNIHIEAPSNTRSALLIRNRGYTGDAFDVLVENVTYIAPNSNSPQLGVVFISTVSGDSPARVSATNITTLPDTLTPNLELGTGDASVLVRQDSITGREVIMTSESSFLADSIVDFQKRFAKQPIITTTLDNYNTSSDRCSSIAMSVKNTGFTARMYRADSLDPFSAAVEREIRWMASLLEW